MTNERVMLFSCASLGRAGRRVGCGGAHLTDAGSSQGSWGTSSPRKALARVAGVRRSTVFCAVARRASIRSARANRSSTRRTISCCSGRGAEGGCLEERFHSRKDNASKFEKLIVLRKFDNRITCEIDSRWYFIL